MEIELPGKKGNGIRRWVVGLPEGFLISQTIIYFLPRDEHKGKGQNRRKNGENEGNGKRTRGDQPSGNYKIDSSVAQGIFHGRSGIEPDLNKC
jgi:hypothetical protein